MNSNLQEANQPLEESNKDEGLSSINPWGCCCYSLTKREFFTFITIWDLVFLIIPLFLIPRSERFLSLIILLIISLSYVSYYRTNTLDNFMNKFYANGRLIFITLELFITVIFGIVHIKYAFSAYFKNVDKPMFHYIILFAIPLFIMAPLLILQLQWSFILKKITLVPKEIIKSKASSVKEDSEEKQSVDDENPEPLNIVATEK